MNKCIKEIVINSADIAKRHPNMSLSEEDIKQIANEVYELQKQDKALNVKEPIYSKEWIKLRKEIDTWCHENKAGYGSGYQTFRFIFEQMISEFKKNRGK